MRYADKNRPDRLTVRLAVGITVLVIVPLAAGLYLLSRQHYQGTIAARHEAAERENRLLAVALRHDMVQNSRQLMRESLSEIGAQPEIQRAMVLDHNGVIQLSSNRSDEGMRISREDPTCMVCHAVTPKERNRWVILDENNSQVLRSVLPIENRPECHRCHDAGERLNGILILDVSLAGVQAALSRDAFWMTVATATLALVLLVGVGLFVRHLILVRLIILGRHARSIAGGALEERAEIRGDDLIATLARDFNNMADATSALVTEVKEREDQMTGVLNSLDDGMIVLDSDFKIVAANRSISRRSCSYSENIRGQNCRDAIGRALPCHSDAECPTARCLTTGRLEMAVYHFPDDGPNAGRIQEVYASPVYSGDGSVAQVVEVWRDITERVREEEHLAEIEHLSSLGVLASGLSHEVNTPLATTLTCADAILGRLESPGPDISADDQLAAIRESAEIIRQQVLRCRKITDQFLRFARGIPPSIEPIDLREVVRSVMALAAPKARESGVSLDMEGGVPLPLVTANTEVVQHVVLNVLVNAIESFDDGGGVISALFKVDENIRLQVRDTGCGIPPEVQKHMFEPFRTQKPRGTGLGLFLSRTFMRRFGGDVRLVDSTVGRGSCIEIVFPRQAGEVS